MSFVRVRLLVTPGQRQQLTLVSLIISAISGLIEVLQGFQTFSACLHHADVNEQLKEFEKLRGLGLQYPEIYGSLVDLWSPASEKLDKNHINIGNGGSDSPHEDCEHAHLEAAEVEAV